MILGPRLRKLALTVHLTFAIGWLGAVVAFLALAVAAVAGLESQSARAAFLVMPLLMSNVIVPLAFGSLLTGLVSALGTRWGLFRHYWVLAKLVLTCIAIAVLLVQLAPIEKLARLAADPASAIAGRESMRPLVHAAGGLLVLLVVQVLGVYKPRGLTRYGSRRQQAEPAEPPP